MPRSFRSAKSFRTSTPWSATHADPTRIVWASDTQRAGFEYGPQPLLLSGGFGAGKTALASLKALYLSDVYPQNRGVIARRVWTELQKTTMATFFKFCQPSAYSYGGSRNDTAKRTILNNGSEILFLHLDQDDIEGVIRGLEINWFFIDQAEECEEETFDLLKSRLGRWDKAQVPDWLVQAELNAGRGWPWLSTAGHPVPPTYALLACNPDTELHWLWRRFHPDSPDWQDHWRLQGYQMLTMNSLDNKYLTAQNREALLVGDESFKRRFVYGQWGIVEGLIHHLAPESLIPGSGELYDHIRQTCTLHRVLDHGDASPTCCLWYGVDPDGNIIFYREYYKANSLISEHRANITALSKTPDGLPERYVSNYADPSIFNKTSQKNGGRWSTADEYQDCLTQPNSTALFWQPADNNEGGTRNRLNEYLRVDPKRVNPFTKSKGSPRIFFITKTSEYPQGLNMTLRELRSQRRKRIGTDNGKPAFSDDREETISDHCLPGDTLVDTPSGQVRIDSLGSTGTVCTPAGPLAFTDCMRYHRDWPLVKVEFDSGHILRCTPEHRLLSDHGWILAADAEGERCLILSKSQLQPKSSWASGITYAVSTSSAKASAFIEWCGNTTMDLYRRVSTSITRTMTEVTTVLGIWSWLRDPDTCHTTANYATIARPSRLHNWLLRHGIAPRLDASGIESTYLRVWLRRGNGLLSVPANSAAKATSRLWWLLNALGCRLGSVIPTAKLPTFASVIRVTPDGTSDVYCLTVNHLLHAFSVEGGVVVSNSYDCVRYAVASRPASYAKPPDPQPSGWTFDALMRENRLRRRPVYASLPFTPGRRF